MQTQSNDPAKPETAATTTEAPKAPVKADAKPKARVKRSTGKAAKPKNAAKPAGDTIAEPAAHPFLAACAAAGVKPADYYSEASSFVTSIKSPVLVPVGVSKYDNAGERPRGLLRCAYAAFGTRPFPARGLCNGALARLTRAGLIAPVAGTGEKSKRNGFDYLRAGTVELAFKLTAAGVKAAAPLSGKPK